MNSNEICGILVMLVPLVVNEIVSNENISEEEATKRFYSSKLYKDLEDDDTKLWHLSPKALYLLYKEEMESGKITYPEE